MEGFFKVSKMPAHGLSDHDFEQAIKEGRLDALLTTLPVKQEARCKNRLFDNLAGYFLDTLFSLGNCGWPYYERNDSPPEAMLNSICLLTTDGDTDSYTEDWGAAGTSSYNTIHWRPDAANTASGGKRFEEDEIEAWQVWVDTGGREAIHFRNKFLYLPSQGESSNIRSIGIFFLENGDGTGGYWEARGKVGRVRLKDANGVPIIMTKSDREILLVEYTFTMVAI